MPDRILRPLDGPLEVRPLSKQAVTKLALDEQDGPAGEVFSDGYRGFASPCDAWRRILIDPKDDLPWRGSGEV